LRAGFDLDRRHRRTLFPFFKAAHDVPPFQPALARRLQQQKDRAIGATTNGRAVVVEDGSPAWRSELARRLCALWHIKLLATSLGITAFLMAYFWVLRHPLFPVTVMPLTALDHAIGFHPESMPLYLSLWGYISFGPAMLSSARNLAKFGAVTLGLSLAGLSIFLLWPTAVAPFPIDWTLHPSMVFLKNLDLAGNACPSMHVAFAVFTAIWLQRVLREMKAARALRWLNWLWCAGIVYSTVATLQHVVLDVLGGAALGSVFAAMLLHVIDPSPAHQESILTCRQLS
jgi:hypothetical protein